VGSGDPGPFNNSYRPIGDPDPLFASAGATYVDPPLLAVPLEFVSSLQIRVWDSRGGSSYEAVLQGVSGALGSSKAFTISPGPEMQPPVNLGGLEPFTIGPITTFWPYYPSPTNLVVSEGQSAQFILSFPTDNDLIAYQWQKESAPDARVKGCNCTGRKSDCDVERLCPDGFVL